MTRTKGSDLKQRIAVLYMTETGAKSAHGCQVWVGGKIGVSPSSVNDWIRNVFIPSRQSLAAISLLEENIQLKFGATAMDEAAGRYAEA